MENAIAMVDVLSYYVKYQVEGESTGFAHLDINVDKCMRTSHGKNIIQGSLSLDNEDEQVCTSLVFGFHRHIHEWWAQVKQQGQGGSGYTANEKKASSCRLARLRQTCSCPL